MTKEFKAYNSSISFAFALFCVVSLASIPFSNAKEIGANEDDPEPGEQIAKLRELLQVEELEVPKLTGELQIDGILF